MKRYTSRPSPMMSTIGLIVGIFMLIFGIVFVTSATRDTKMPGFAVAFMAVWFVALIGIMIYHFNNAFGKKGVPTTIIEGEDTHEDQPPRDRLQQLEDLHKRNLITEEEYQTKRQEIVDKL